MRETRDTGPDTDGIAGPNLVTRDRRASDPPRANCLWWNAGSNNLRYPDQVSLSLSEQKKPHF